MKNSLHFFILLLLFPFVSFGQQLENPGFENWENIGMGLMEPVDWSTIKTADNPSLASLAPLTYERSDSAHSGNYSLKLYNVQVFANLVATGAITNGRFHAVYNLDSSFSYTDTTDASWNTPFTWRPDSLEGWFKFFPKGDDRAQFKFILHVNECKLPENGTMPNWIGVAVNVTEPGVTYAEWTRFAIPFTYFDDRTPRYILNVINSGDSTSAIDSSYLLVDDLHMIYGPSGISDQKIPDAFLVNANDRLIISLQPAENYLNQWFYLIDLNGKTVLTEQLDNNQVLLPSALPCGIYVAVLKNRDRQFVQKVMIR
jgi:hypothetical protein